MTYAANPTRRMPGSAPYALDAGRVIVDANGAPLVSVNRERASSVATEDAAHAIVTALNDRARLIEALVFLQQEANVLAWRVDAHCPELMREDTQAAIDVAYKLLQEVQA